MVEFYKANLRNEKNILPEVVFFYVIWYKMKWSFDYKINQLSLHGSQTVSRDAQSLGKCLQCYALYHFHLRKFLIRYSIFLTTPFAGSHLNWSIKTSGDSLVACKNQNLTSWPTGNISETLETWTVKGRDVKIDRFTFLWEFQVSTCKCLNLVASCRSLIDHLKQKPSEFVF